MLRKMTRLRAVALAGALCASGLVTMLAGSLMPGVAQGVIAVLQNGLPTGPSLFGFGDATAGMYFGTGRVGISKHLESGVPISGNVPVISACGGPTAGDAGSTDTAGSVTNGGGVTTCTITFGTAYTAAPSCMVLDNTAVRASMVSTVTTTAITITAITAADKVSWFCVAKSGG